MARNPKSPISYNSNPRKRSQEKLLKTIELLTKFKSSTRKLILNNLKLASHSHHRYLNKMESQGILKKIDLYSLKSKAIYILGEVGIGIASELINSNHSFTVNPLKLNYLNIRHDLAVQKAVLDRSKTSSYKSEWEIKSDPTVYYKTPDAILYDEGKIIAFEVELTAKSDKRLYKAFFEHCQNLENGNYNHVIYLFHNKSLKEYYYSKFVNEKWFTYKTTSQNRLVVDSQFDKNITEKHKENFCFIHDEDILNFW